MLSYTPPGGAAGGMEDNRQQYTISRRVINFLASPPPPATPPSRVVAIYFHHFSEGRRMDARYIYDMLIEILNFEVRTDVLRRCFGYVLKARHRHLQTVTRIYISACGTAVCDIDSI